jgi:hypothetical protein
MSPDEALKQYRPMIEKVVWTNVRRFKIEPDEVRSEAFLVFCKCLQTFDETKASFSTYLYGNLEHLVMNKCSRMWKTRARDIEWASKKRFNSECEEHEDFLDLFPSRYDVFSDSIMVLETASILSEDARTILNFIISREWEVPGETKRERAYFNFTARWFRYYYDWMPGRTHKAWKEIREWWRENAA